jgi:hypothetical protein
MTLLPLNPTAETSLGDRLNGDCFCLSIQEEAESGQMLQRRHFPSGFTAGADATEIIRLSHRQLKLYDGPGWDRNVDFTSTEICTKWSRLHGGRIFKGIMSVHICRKKRCSRYLLDSFASQFHTGQLGRVHICIHSRNRH